MAITEQYMALSEGADTDQPEEATTEEPRPGGRTPRERFDALPEDLKDKILEANHDYNTHHDWWEGTYDCFVEDMKNIGIEVHRMYFSGFSSQGDGACFDGRISDWKLFLKSVGHNEPALITHAEDTFVFAVQQRGHYYHENCTSFEVDLPLPESDTDEWFLEHFSPYQDDRHSIREAVWMAIINKYEHGLLENEFIEVFKDHMRDLYKRLEDEHDYLTSDEAILDSLEADDQLEDAINDALETDHA